MEPGRADTTDRAQLRLFKQFVLDQIKVPIGHGKWRPYKPHEGQEFLHFTDWNYFCAPWGARSGKTIAAAAEILFTMGLPGTRTWVVAPNYELTDRVFDYVYRWLVVDMIFGQGSVKKASKSKDNRYVEMQWGSFVRGKSAENPDSLAGEQLDFIAFDECARCTEQIFLEFLEGRTLDRKGRVLFISTPRGYNWFRDYFNRGQDPEMQEKGWSSLNFPTWENPYIDEEFLRSKRSETPDDIWRQEYGGDFVTQAGLIWPDFRNRLKPDGHIFNPDDFVLDKNWNVIRAIDVGVRHPTACLWAAVDEESNVWIFREYQEVNPIHEAHAEAIAALSEEPVYRTFISPDARRKGGLSTQDGQPNLCALDIYRRSGVYAVPAADNVSAGIAEVARYFRASLEDNPDHPTLYISKNCQQLRNGLLNYIWSDPKVYKELDPAEKPRKYNDDLMDALRYLVSSRPVYTPVWYEEERDQEHRDPRRGIKGLATVPY